MAPAVDLGGILVAPRGSQRGDSRHAGGRGLAAADQPAGTRIGGHAVLGDDLAGHDRRDVAVGGLVQPAPTGGQVAGDDGPVQPQRGVVDDVEVGLVARPRCGRGRPGPPTRAGTDVSSRTASATESRPDARSRAQCASMYVGKLASQIIP